jgi:hypothetical protein
MVSAARVAGIRGAWGQAARGVDVDHQLAKVMWALASLPALNARPLTDPSFNVPKP